MKEEEQVYFNLGKSLHVFNDIELFINFIITHHIKPRNEDFFINHILSTSVISFGAKIKILINLEIFDKKQITKIREYSTNRNVFAHSNKKNFYDVEIDEKKPDEVNVTKTDIIFKTNSEGKIEKKKL